MKKIGLVAFFFETGCAWAASGSGSVFDLKWAFLNFFILAVLLVWKVKNPLSEMFHQNFSDVKYLHSVAQEKDKESNMKYEMYKKKIEGVEKDYDAVLEKFRRKGMDFASEYKREGDAFIEKLKREKNRKIEVEKNKMLQDVESALLSKIIFKTKERIEVDPKLKSQVTRGLISKIG